MKNTNWNTHKVTGYTHDIAQDQRSAGGVHLHQIRKARHGWQARIVQTNGRHKASGPVHPISEAEGEAAYATAKTR